MIYKNCFLSVGGTDLSAYIESCEPSFEVEQTDDTVMGDDTRSNEPGLLNWSFSVTFKNPFASGGPDATLWAIRGTTAAVIWRPDSGTASATNPQYTGTASLASYSPVSGSVGDQGTMPAEFVAAGTLARAVS